VAYEKGIIISRSEIWEFTVQCKEPVKPSPNDSYRELKLLVNGNYYFANRSLKFSFRNDYNTQKLRYAILDMADAGKELKNVPEVKLQYGLNKNSKFKDLEQTIVIKGEERAHASYSSKNNTTKVITNQPKAKREVFEKNGMIFMNLFTNSGNLDIGF